MSNLIPPGAIIGKKIYLLPMYKHDRDWFFNLATQSDGTEFWYGEKCGEDIPPEEKFLEDFNENYYTDENPLDGRLFFIYLKSDHSKIGGINYNKIKNQRTELDIIIGDKKHMGKGYGTEAMFTIIDYLKKTFGLTEITLEVISDNPRAIAAYKKLGFEHFGQKKKGDVNWLLMSLKL